MSRKKDIITFLAGNRRIIQTVTGIAVYYVILFFQISLWWVFAFGSVLGIIWGKVFCRWMCPVGIIMEIIMKISPNASFQKMYQYHKVGCPIAWVSGWLNKFSLYKIELNTDTCKDCGLCDNACYMPTIDKNRFSLYKPGMTDPAQNFSCSKCLECLAVCPNESLTLKLKKPKIYIK